MDNGELRHFGVKGMKWGVRKDRERSSKISAHRQKTIDAAKKSGMNQKEAEEYAAKRARIEKIMIAAGATTIGAAAVYVAHSKYVKQYRGEVLKSGSNMQRIVTKRHSRQVVEVPEINSSMKTPFYASFTKGDNAVYKALLNGDDKRVKLTLSPNSDIKVASVDQSQKVFKQLYKADPEFKKSVDRMSTQVGRRATEYTKGVDTVRDLRKTYAVFDHELVRSDPQSRKISNKFYDAMKKAGYDAIYDLNDRDRERLSKKPVIVFNKLGDIKVKDVEHYKASSELIKGTGIPQYLLNQRTDTRNFTEAALVGSGLLVGAGVMRKDDVSDYSEEYYN